MGEQCQFEFDDAAVDELLAADLVDWECPHEALPNSVYCPFHRAPSETSAETVRDAFLTAIKDSGKGSKQFAGARLDVLDLAYVVVEAPDMYPIDLRYATVTGTLDVSNATIKQPLLLDGAVIETVSAEAAMFRKSMSLVDAEIKGRFVAEDVTFEREFDASGTCFCGDVQCNGVNVEGPLVFADATFEVTADFFGCQCRGPAMFPYTRFDGWADFGEGTFGEETVFEGASFEDVQFTDAVFEHRGIFDEVTCRQSNFTGLEATELSVTDAEFRGNAQFGDSQFTGEVTYRDCVFEGVVSFTGSTFTDDVAFFGVEFEEEVRLTECECHGETTFEQVLFVNLDFTGSTFQSLSIGHGITTIAGVTLTKTEYTDSSVRLTDATIKRGTLSQAEETEIFYDLNGATVGDVEFRSSSDSTELLDHFFLYDTNFEGFDFSEYRRHLAPEWDLHIVPEAHDTPETTPAGLEVTYLKARNGANAVGDTHSAAEFFIKEMRYRRRRYFTQFLNVSGSDTFRHRMRLSWRIITNLLYDVTSGFGERPIRVITASLGTILGFAVLYAVTFPLAGHPAPYQSSIPFAGYIVFSFEGFVRFVVGGGATVNNTLLRLLAEFQGFVGGFFIGLFVFVLTRAVDH
jgi:uncharacterized protein YjbI with pentapeptide repeats